MSYYCSLSFKSFFFLPQFSDEILKISICRYIEYPVIRSIMELRPFAGEPILECAADSMSISFMTEKEFEGHVYVKGHYENSLCRTDATLKKNVNFTVPFSLCDVRRQRSVFNILHFQSNPRGLYVCMTVIITFHPVFSFELKN
ncbi:unnamed protein product [Onchocerca flexuosa]|uniref:ZP domain-containing protein n=1 Tax=Onchocerca flexuosa TaxID=387005 RepID=A0A183I120_9BILA|nr:unnamed protein product [Onchocerca flexuosa]